MKYLVWYNHSVMDEPELHGVYTAYHEAEGAAVRLMRSLNEDDEELDWPREKDTWDGGDEVIWISRKD